MIPHASKTGIRPNALVLGDAVVTTLCWMVGIAAGHYCRRAEPWLIAGAAAALVALAMWLSRRPRALRAWSLVALIALGGAWVIERDHYTDAADLRQYLSARPELVQVTGIVGTWPHLGFPPEAQPQAGPRDTAATTWVLDAQSITIDSRPRPASGRLRVRLHQPDLRPHQGDLVRLTGWLSAPPPPTNPGELDPRTLLADQGIDAYLTLRDRGDWQLLTPASPLRRLGWLPAWLSNSASDSLRLGMRPATPTLELLDSLLLGRRDSADDTLYERFQRVGLAYLLVISGAHLSVLLGLVWMAASLATGYPRRAAMAVLLVLGFYLLIVPAHVPIIRAALMAALLCLAYGAGRRIDVIKVLALSAFLLLIWRPDDLFDAGFQLSFVVVAAAFLFVPPTARWIWSRPMSATGPDRPRQLAARWLADYLAFNLVATLFALPLIAYHFGVINPPQLALSILLFPCVALLMGLGFIKILAGWLFPSLGMLLAYPLQWTATLLSQPVAQAAAWPATQLTLPHPPSALWTITALVVITALFSGWFSRRRMALVACLAICTLSLLMPDMGWGAARQTIAPTPVAPLRLTALSVGNSSCFLLRLADAQARYTILYNCGWRESASVGKNAIIPVLHTLGVTRIDALVIANPSVNRADAVMSLIDQFPIARVLTTYYVLDAAHHHPHAAAGLLIAAIRSRKTPIETILRGRHEHSAGADLDVLWPPPDLPNPHPDDTSLVLSVRAAGRRVLLNADIQQAAIAALLKSGQDLHADVTDLPHRGGFVAASPRWYQAVAPSIVLQSTAPPDRATDKWSALINASHTTRLITGLQGMVSVEVDAHGKMTCSEFLSPDKPSALPEMQADNQNPRVPHSIP